MALYDEDDDSVGLLDEDEKKRLGGSPVRSPQSITDEEKPSSTSLTDQGSTATETPVEKTETPKSITGATATVPSQPVSVTQGPLDTMGPAGQHYKDLLGQRPEYHGLKKVADILGRTTSYGRLIEQGAGIGTLGYEQKLAQAERDAAGERAQQMAPLVGRERQLNVEKLAAEQQFNTPEKRQTWMGAHPEIVKLMTAPEQADFLTTGKWPTREPTQPKPADLNLMHAEAVRDAIAAGRDPNSDPKVQQLVDQIQAKLKQPVPKHASGEAKLDEGIPTGIYDAEGKLWNVNDPKLPEELKPYAKQILDAHAQKLKEQKEVATAGRSVYAGARAVNVITPDGQVHGVDGLDLPAFLRSNPGSVVQGAGVNKAMGQQALINDVRASAKTVRENLDVLDRKGFDYAKLAAMLADPNSTAGQYLQSVPREMADDKAQQFVSDLFNLREQAMSMRAILGAGQGSEDVRHAILATLPGISSGSKGFGEKQIANMLKVLERVERGVPGVPQRPETNPDTGNKSGEDPARPQGVPAEAVWNPQVRRWQMPTKTKQ